MSAGARSTTGERYCPTCEKTFVGGERCPDDNTRLVRLAESADTLIGRDLDGRYTIREKLGQGGMGSVYRSMQHSVGREVAIKVVMPSLVSDPIVVKRFLREAKLASRLSHPNAVSVLDFGQTNDGLFYLVMELVQGRTLDRVLEAERVLAPARVVRIGMQVCDALEGAHAMQIVHRDLKPANVMLMPTGRDLVKVLDFGLAKSLTPDAARTTMTNAGALLGTPAYMPPELVTGQASDARSDLYSLGCVLYAAAAGRPPFVANTVHEVIAMHASEPPAPLTEVPSGLAAVIHRLLAKRPEDRFENAGDARDALERSLSSDPEAAAPTMVSAPSTILGWSSEIPVPKRPSRAQSSLPTLIHASAPGTGPSPQTSVPVLLGMPSVASASRPMPMPGPAPLPAAPVRRGRAWLWLLALLLVAAAAGVAYVLVH